MYSTAGVSAVSASTSCALQTLSKSVRALMASRLCGFQPGHAGTQLRPDLLDGMRQVGLQQFGILGPAAFVFGDPLAREFTLLDFPEDLAHFLLGRLVDDARAAGQIAVFGSLADEAMHLGDSALVQ